MIFDAYSSTIDSLVGDLASRCVAHNITLSTAESCTGGLVAACCTAFSGSSAWFSGAVVAYENRIKETVLDVPHALLMEHGAVSGPCVEQMALGVRALLRTSASVAVSGVAGPTGGTPAKPVGTVWIAWSKDALLHSKQFLFAGDRQAVRMASVVAALLGLLELISPGE